MTSFALISVENDYKVDVTEGKVTVGRGPYLKITDKRVSRNHATLEVADGSLTILPTHTNPTFYQACGETKFEPLEKDEVKKLESGDCISFLPNDLIFRIEKKDSTGIIEDTTAEQSEHKAIKLSPTKDCNVETNSKVLEDNSGKDNDKVLDRKDVVISKEYEDLNPEEMVGFHTPEREDEEDNKYSDEDEKNKIEETAQLLNKTRVLPNWMTENKGKEAKESPQQGKTTKTNVIKVAAVAEVKVDKDLIDSPGKPEKGLEENENKTVEEKENKTSEKNDGDDQSDTNDDLDGDLIKTPEQEKPSVSTEEEDKKRKRDESEDEEQSSKKEKKLPSCPYGSRCYRKNPVHFQEYSHEEESDKSEEEQDDLPECPYGEYCYRKNPRHRREYKHTPQPKTRERKAKRKAATGKIRDDDEDGANDYDYDDSFIDDESESEHEASDDSEWMPSGGEDDDNDEEEDVGELLSEARNFARNKKMMKPT